MRITKKELVETLRYANAAFLIVQLEKNLLELKLNRIKEICHEAPAIDSELSLRILEAIGAEDENN